MVAGGTGYGYDINTWNKQFLKDIGAPATPQTLAYLQAWEGREGHGQTQDYGYNPLNTMMGGYGGNPQPGSIGIMNYPSLMAGASANAAALTGNGSYTPLLQALRSGNPNTNTPYGNALSTWSGGGYNTLGNYQGYSNDPLSGYIQSQQQQNLPSAVSSTAQAGNIQQQQMLNQLMTQQAAGFAGQEAGFQLENLGLSRQELGIAQGALQRQFGLVPKEYGLQKGQFGVEAAGLKQQQSDITREYTNQLQQIVSSGAASGSLFTKGQRDTTQLTKQREHSALRGVQLSERSLKLREQGAGLAFKEQMASLRDEQKNYGILAKRYGISEQEVRARLQNTLQQLNLSGQSTASDLAAALVGANMQTYQAMNPAIPFGFPITGGTPQGNTYPR